MMALLRPGVRKKDMRSGERPRCDHVLDYFHGIVLHDAHVRYRVLFEPLEQPADAGRVHLDRDEVELGMRSSDRRGGLSHAESDFEDFRIRAAKGLREIDRAHRKRNSEARQQWVVGALLRG